MTICYAASLTMLSAELNPTERLSKESVVSVNATSYDLCEYNNSHPGTGVAIVNQQTGEVVFAAEIEHRGRAIKTSLDSRRSLRRARRQRKTRYRKSRFDNRTRAKGWLPPSLENRIENVYTIARRLQLIYPLKSVAYELVRFDMQLMQNPTIEGVEYQQGKLQGFELREYVLIKYAIERGANSSWDFKPGTS